MLTFFINLFMIHVTFIEHLLLSRTTLDALESKRWVEGGTLVILDKVLDACRLFTLNVGT